MSGIHLLVVSVSILSSFLGCVSSNPRVNELAKSLAEKQEENLRLKMEIEALRQDPRPQDPGVSKSVSARSPQLLPVDEKGLFESQLRALKHSDLDTAMVAADLLYKSYPNGPYTELALFNAALSNFEQSRPKECLSTLAVLQRDYPLSVEIPRVQFLRARVYKSLGDSEKYRELLKEIARRYPGSPEQRLAKQELTRMFE